MNRSEDGKRLQILLEHLAGVLWTTDRELRFTSSQGAGLHELGLEPDQVVGMSLSEYFATEDPTFEPVAAHLRALQGESVSWRTEWQGRVFQSHCEPVRNPEGEIDGVVGIAVDVTERAEKERERETLLSREKAARREAEEAGLRYHNLVHTLDAIVWEADPDGVFTFVSQRAADVLGYPSTSWIGRPGFWQSIIHPEDRATAVSICMEATKRGEDHQFEYRAIRADGGTVWLQDFVRVILDEDGKAAKLRGVMVDITRTKRAEERNRTLNQELSARQAELESYHDLVTHDLSNLSMTLLGIVDRLLDRAGRHQDPLEQDLLRRARRQAHELTRLAENAKVLVRVREGRVPQAAGPESLLQSLERVASLVRDIHFDRDVQIALDCPDTLRVHGVPFLDNVFLNLMDNAVRHGKREATPRVRVDAVIEDGTVKVCIRGGQPPDPELMAHLFERHMRGGASTGSGLGLAVVREIVTGAGGGIEAGVFEGGSEPVFEARLTLPGG